MKLWYLKYASQPRKDRPHKFLINKIKYKNELNNIRASNKTP